MKKLILGIIIVCSAGFAYSVKAQDATQTLLSPVTASSSILRIVPRNSNYGLKISTTSPLWLSALNCTSFSNGGVLTTDANGFVECQDDDGGAGGSGITSLGGLTSSSQLFGSSTADSNLRISVVSSGSTHTLQPAWNGVLAVSRGGIGTTTLGSLTVGSNLSITGGQSVLIGTSTQISLGSNVVTAVSTSSAGTVFTGSISANTLSLIFPANLLSTTTAAATYEPIQTKGNLTTVSPLQFDATRQVIGGAAALSVASGYNIPLTASTTNWNTFYDTPSNRITAGTNLSWSGNTLNASVGGSGNSAWTIGNGLIYNATSTDSVLIGTSTPTTSKLFVQGSAGQLPLRIASSTGTTLFTVDTFGTTTIANLGTGNVRANAGSLFVGPIDISADTNLAAGRSLTLSGDSVDADAELYTHKKTIVITSVGGSISATTSVAQFELPVASTVTEVSCSTDVGTATIQFDERARATPNTAGTDVMTSTLACDTNAQTTTTFSNAGIAADVPVNLDIDSVASSPTRIRIHVTYTNDD